MTVKKEEDYMSWYDTHGNEENYVLWSKIRFYRNIKGLCFFKHSDVEAVGEYFERTEKLLQKNGFHEYENTVDKASLLSLAEKQYADPGFIESESSQKSLFFNEPCSLSVSVGGVDFFCIQSLLSGLSVDECYKIASRAEELIDEEFELAYSEKYGYLSPLFSHSGAGFDISAAVFLPAASRMGKISEISSLLFDSGISLYPLFSGMGKGADVYMLSLSPSKERSEREEVLRFSRSVENILSLEKEYGGIICGNNTVGMADISSRAEGIMEYAHSIGTEEFLTLISDIRFGLCLGVSDRLSGAFSSVKLNSLLCECLPVTLSLSMQEYPKSRRDIDIYRAEQLRNFIISAKESV